MEEQSGQKSVWLCAGIDQVALTSVLVDALEELEDIVAKERLSTDEEFVRWRAWGEGDVGRRKCEEMPQTRCPALRKPGEVHVENTRSECHAHSFREARRKGLAEECRCLA